MDKYCIYKITNIVNGKIYVGQTCNFEQRMREHKYYSKNMHLRNAFKKYGLENFQFEVIIDGLTKGEADELEDKYITIWELTNRKKGYNLRRGGSHGKHSMETIERMRVAQRNRKPYIKRKRGKNKYTRKKPTDYFERIKPVQQIDKNTGEVVAVYISISDAAKAVDTDMRNISKVCHGRQLSCKGYNWKFAEKDNLLEVNS